MPLPHIFANGVGFLNRQDLDDNFAAFPAIAALVTFNDSSIPARVANTISLAAAAALNNGAVFVGPGTVWMNTWNIPANLQLSGAGIGVTTFKGDGDLFRLTTQIGFTAPSFRNFTVLNDVTRGRLFSIATGADINRIKWIDVEFNKATKHIESTDLTVSWSFTRCRFSDASICSRDLFGAWVMTETGSYVWFNTIGLRISGTSSSTNSSYGSVYEQNTDAAIIIEANNGDALGFLLSGTHFEANGTGTLESDVILRTVTANQIRGIQFQNCSWFFPTAGQTVRIKIVAGGGGNLTNLSVDGGYVGGVVPICSNVAAMTVYPNVTYQASAIPNAVTTTLRENALGTTIGAAGGASALPAAPVGYISISLPTGSFKIPYYNP